MPRTSPDPRLRRRRTFGLAAGVLALALASGCASEPAIWFDEVGALEPWTPIEIQATTRYAAETLFQEEGSSPELAGGLANDEAPRIVFLSVSDGEKPAEVLMGRGRGLGAALDDALQQALRRRESGLALEWIKLDIVRDVDAIPEEERAKKLRWEGGIHGLALARGSDIAFLPDEILGYGLLSGARLRLERIPESLELRKIRAPFGLAERLESDTLYRFTTFGAFLDRDRAIPLFRGHRTFPGVTPDELLEASRLGADYLARSTESNGVFAYSYNPDTGQDASDYNMLRHAGTIYAMMEHYEVTRDETLLAAVRRAIDYLVFNIRECKVGAGSYRCVVDDGAIKLGGNALAAIALSKYITVTGDTKMQQHLLPLGRWIQAVQSPEGEFTIHKQSYPRGVNSDFVSGYYPGEAILALCRIYDVVGDESLLDSAERAATWLITVRDGGKALSELSHDHWLLYGLNDVHRHRRGDLYVEHTRRLTQVIVKAQRRDAGHPDWLGSYYSPPRSTPTAIRSEGLAAAYRLLRRVGLTVEAEQALEAIQLGILFELGTQIGPERAMYLADPPRALGAFQASLTNLEIRIDYVQHNISALLALRSILLDRAAAGEE